MHPMRIRIGIFHVPQSDPAPLATGGNEVLGLGRMDGKGKDAIRNNLGNAIGLKKNRIKTSRSGTGKLRSHSD